MRVLTGQYDSVLAAMAGRISRTWHDILVNFQAIVTAKNINGEARLHSKVDEKKVVISEASIRRDLWFGDEESIDCQPNETIFEQLSLMGAKTTAWNEFSSTIASAVICLAIYQKFNFSKYIFDSMVKNLDSATKFLMFLRDTPLFLTMMVQAQEELGEDIAIPTKTHPTPIITQPLTSKPQKKQKPRNPKRQDTKETHSSDPTNKALNENTVPTRSNDPPLSRVNTLRSGKDRLKLKELMELFTKLSDRGMIPDIDANQDIYLVNVHRDEDIFGVNDQDDTSMFDAEKDQQGEEIIVEKTVADKEVNVASITTSVTAAATTAVSFDELTTAQALVEIKTSRPKAKSIVILELSETPTTTTIPISLKVQDKGKAEIDEQDRLAEEEAQKALEANIVVIEQWHDVQAKIDADYELA
nr:hypothetical protein [Tanacetum cinerariifolium]